MTKAKKIVDEINGFLAAVGVKPLALPSSADALSELEFLKAAKQEYKERLMKTVPKYQKIENEALIPDGILIALRNYEAELKQSG